MTDLVLHLKTEFFNQIKNNQKPFEYRKYNKYWGKRLIGRKYDNIIFCLAYPRKDDTDKRIVKKYLGYELQKIIHPQFGNKETDVFAIKVEQ